jgi:hypothetical protein
MGMLQAGISFVVGPASLALTYSVRSRQLSEFPMETAGHARRGI